MRTLGLLLGILGLAASAQAQSTTFLRLPNTGGVGGYSSATEVLSSPNQMRCTAFVPSVGIANATEISFYAVAGTASAVGVCIYDASGSTIAATGALTCGANTLCAKTGLTAFSLTAGTKYFLCWTSSDTTLTLASAGVVREEISNAFVVNHGTGSAGVAGVCPGTMGALSATFGVPAVPYVVVSEE